MKKIKVVGKINFFKGLLSNIKPMVKKADEAFCVVMEANENEEKKLKMKLGVNDKAYSLIKDRVENSDGGLSLTEIK